MIATTTPLIKKYRLAWGCSDGSGLDHGIRLYLEFGPTESKMEQNNSTELLCHSFLTISSEGGPPDPIRSQTRFSDTIGAVYNESPAKWALQVSRRIPGAFITHLRDGGFHGDPGGG